VLIVTDKIKDPYRSVTAEEILRLDCPAPKQLVAKQMREERKWQSRAQSGRRFTEGSLARKALEIPEYIYARIPQEELTQDRIHRTMCKVWHEFPDFRRLKGNCPFCKRR